MANSNVLDISKEWREASASIEAHNTAIREAIALLPQLGKGYSAPSESIAKMAQATEKLDRASEKRVRSMQQSERAMERQRLAEIKLAQDRERAFDKYEKQLAREEAKLKTAEGMYQRIQNGLNEMSNAYRDLALRKQLNGTLTKGEERQMEFLSKRIKEFDTALKAVDASMGKYQRNVGNYASGFNPLSNSINQLTREAPAFANSVQTGFMAISNNLPIFFDAISQTRDEIKRLRADGQQVPGLFKQLVTSLFSWGTALSVGVTLLTFYGKDIVEFGKNLFTTAKAFDAVKESQKQLSDVSIQGRKDAVEEQLKLKTLLEVAKDTALSYKERMIAVKQLQETYPAYFGNLKEEKILAGQTAEAEKELTDAILSRAKANAAVSRITENQGKIIDLSIEELKVKKDLQKTESALQKIRANVTSGAGRGAAGLMMDQAEATRRLNLITAEKNQLEAVNNTLTSFAIEKQKESIKLDYKETKAKKEKTEAQKEYTDPSSLKAMEEMISALEAELKATDLTSERYNFLSGVLSAVKQSYEALIDAMKDKEPLEIQSKGVAQVVDVTKQLQDSASKSNRELERQAEIALKNKQALFELKKATDDYITSLSQLAVNQGIDALGLQSLKMFTDLDANGMSTFDKLIAGADSFKEKFAITFQAVGDVAQNVFNMIANASNQRFAEERQRLDEQYAYQKQFVNGNAEAESELLTQMERKKREIANREAKAKRDQTIFNILMNTAQGVTAALATVPPNPVLAGIIGALGAAQLAMASSVQLPQYYKGRKGGKRELAWTDECGAEIHVDKSGRIKDFGSNRGARLKMLDEGDSIYTAEESTKILSRMRSGGADKGNAPVIIERQVATETTEINIDKNGIFATIRKGSQNAQLVNNHLRIRKQNV